MRAGDLRHTITIQSASITRNSLGEEVESWSTTTTVPARIEPLQGRELEYAQKIHSDITHRITIRYVSGITSKGRILFGSRVFNILSPPINQDERNISLTIMVNESA